MHIHVVAMHTLGTYQTVIKYAEMEITGSPFYIDVFDPSQVRVSPMPRGILGKPFTFQCKLVHAALKF